MRILFQGDSVTDCHRDRSDFWGLGEGYVKYTVDALKAMFPNDDIEFINRGISGNRTCDVLARADEDIVDLKPDIVTMLIGVNDTWRRYDMNLPTTEEQFVANYEAIISKIKETGAKFIMLEPFLIYNMGRDGYREDLNPKIDETRKLAAKYADKYIALDGILASAAVCCDNVADISADGVHPAELGKKIIAENLVPILAEFINSIKSKS